MSIYYNIAENTPEKFVVTSDKIKNIFLFFTRDSIWNHIIAKEIIIFLLPFFIATTFS